MTELGRKLASSVTSSTGYLGIAVMKINTGLLFLVSVYAVVAIVFSCDL